MVIIVIIISIYPLITFKSQLFIIIVIISLIIKYCRFYKGVLTLYHYYYNTRMLLGTVIENKSAIL